MKYRILTIIAVVATLSTSCNKWLDIIPEDTTTEEQLFSDAGGYHAAINGLYQALASSSLYGKNLSWGYLSALSQYYDNASTNNSKTFSYTEQYEYDSKEVLAFGESIWSSAYNTIANANNILQHLEIADKGIFPEKETEINVIKGESLAVRALLHFDLLRLFAEAPAANAQAQGIPYIKAFPTIFSERLSASEVINNVISDLETARDLIAPVDTVFSKQYMNSTSNRYMASNSSIDYFFTARGTRLNYIAIQSLLARVYAYKGDLAKAYQIAKEIDDVYVKQEMWYKYTTAFSDSDSESGRAHKLIDEVLVSFYNETLANDYQQTVSNSALAQNSYALKNINAIFPDTEDIRYRKLLSTLGIDVKVSLKYMERSPASVKAENMIIPVMRLSELKLMMAEYLLGQNNKADALALVNELLTARGCAGSILPEDASAETISQTIRAEYWRENVGEGQYFFYCKRINAATINNNGSFIDMKGKYTMQIPDSQININN